MIESSVCSLRSGSCEESFCRFSLFVSNSKSSSFVLSQMLSCFNYLKVSVISKNINHVLEFVKNVVSSSINFRIVDRIVQEVLNRPRVSSSDISIDVEVSSEYDSLLLAKRPLRLDELNGFLSLEGPCVESSQVLSSVHAAEGGGEMGVKDMCKLILSYLYFGVLNASVLATYVVCQHFVVRLYDRIPGKN